MSENNKYEIFGMNYEMDTGMVILIVILTVIVIALVIICICCCCVAGATVKAAQDIQKELDR